MIVQVQYGYYLLVSDRHEGEIPVPEAEEEGVSLTAAPEIVTITTFTESGPVDVETHLFDSDPRELEDGNWDVIMRTRVHASGPLEVRAWDFTPAFRSPGPITEGPGDWNVVLFARGADRVESRVTVEDPEEEHFLGLWPA